MFVRLTIAALFIFTVPFAVSAESAATTALAKVVSITSQATEEQVSTRSVVAVQELRAEIVSGVDKGLVVSVRNDFEPIAVGDYFYVLHTKDTSINIDSYTVAERYRLPQLGYLFLLFVLAIFLFGGIQGVRGLLALGMSLAVIFYVLIPAMLAGYSTLLVAVGVACIITIVGSYVTHGVNRVTSSAVLGMCATVCGVALLAYGAVHMLLLTGFANDEASYLRIAGADIDFAGLLLGGMIIGFLGVLYDAAIGQSVAVDELFAAAPNITTGEVYLRALRIGREHIGALVNTLAIAYVGVSLPLLLLLALALPDTSMWFLINREEFATELARMMIGGIGVVAVVPLTTIISIYILRGSKGHGQHGTHGHRH